MVGGGARAGRQLGAPAGCAASGCCSWDAHRGSHPADPLDLRAPVNGGTPSRGGSGQRLRGWPTRPGQAGGRLPGPPGRPPRVLRCPRTVFRSRSSATAWARLCLRDPQTHGTPDRSATTPHPVYGQVAVDAWTNLHTRTAPHTTLTVIRVCVERLPGQRRPPQPLWLAWIGGPLPDDLHQVWRWSLRRFHVE